MPRSLLAAAATAAALLVFVPAASAIEVGMDTTTKVLYVDGDATGEVNDLEIYRS